MREIPGRRPAGKPSFDFQGGGEYFCPFPFAHLAGLSASAMYPVLTLESTAVLGLPDRPATPMLMKEIIDYKKLKGIYSPPSLIEAVATLPGGLESLRTLSLIIYAGGPLSVSCGNDLAKHADVQPICEWFLTMYR